LNPRQCWGWVLIRKGWFLGDWGTPFNDALRRCSTTELLAYNQGMMPHFTVRALLVWVAVLAGYCALLARWPMLFGFLSIPLGILGLGYSAKKAGANINLGVVAAIAIIGMVLVGLLLPDVPWVHGGTSRRTTCINNLHQIGLAVDGI
jgi:hypothetical protein